MLGGCLPGSDQGQIAAFNHATALRQESCQPGEKSGAADGHRGSLRYNVRTPSKHEPTFAHPVLVVYAAAGMSAGESEALTGLTTEATKNGWIVAYADHEQMSVGTVRKLAMCPRRLTMNGAST